MPQQTEPILPQADDKIRRQSVITLYDGQNVQDDIVTEVPVSLVYNGISHAVMMAMPENLEAFGRGFSISEGIIRDSSEIYGIDVLPACQGWRVEMEISSQAFWKLKQKRRTLMGHTSCGLCGTESLEAFNVADIPALDHTVCFSLQYYEKALSHWDSVQPVMQKTGGTHAALWLDLQGEFVAGVEDVGRHVALDKLIGILSEKPARKGILLLSSRASFEMVQKAARAGIEIMLTVSAPTTLAVETAHRLGITLLSFCRPGKGKIYTHPERILDHHGPLPSLQN